MPRVKLFVPGISCEHCVRSVEKAVSDVEGVSKATGDVASKTITVDYTAPADQKAIRNALIAIGYPAEGTTSG